MENPTLLFFIAVLCAGIGFTLGGFVGSLLGGKADKPPVPDGEEIARLWRDPRSKRFLVEMDGTGIPLPQKLTPAQKERLVEGLADLRTWLDEPSLGSQRPAFGAAPPVGTGVTASPETPKRMSMNPVDILTRAVKTDVKTPFTSRSIAAQIDEVLQEALSSPALANSPLKDRGLRLMELPGKGMVVLIGLDQYDGIDAVPDPDARKLLRACVAEWERRTAKD